MTKEETPARVPRSLDELAWFSRAALFPGDAEAQLLKLGADPDTASAIRQSIAEGTRRSGGAFNIVSLYQAYITDETILPLLEAWVEQFFATAEAPA